MKITKLQVGAASISLIVCVLALIAWGQSFGWQFSRLSTYKLFPLFGLLAFSLMWSHYVVNVLRQTLNIDKSAIKTYIEITSILVIIALCLHPGLLVWQLWRDGFGLPPESYLQHYIAPSLRWIALLGTTSLFVFLIYELRRWHNKKPWWRWILYANDIAMLAIIYHGLRLGTQLQGGWFKFVWYFYGLVFILCLAYIYSKKLRTTEQNKP